MTEPESEPTTTPGLLIPTGTALNIADMAEALADDLRNLAQNPSEAGAEDLLTTMRLLHQQLTTAFKDLDADPGTSEGESESVLPISSTQTDAMAALVALRKQIIDSEDLAGCLAIETQRRRSLEATVLRLVDRMDEIEKRDL